MSLFIEAAPTVKCPECSGLGFVMLDFCPRDCWASQQPRGEGCFHTNVRCTHCGGRGRVKDEAAAGQDSQPPLAGRASPAENVAGV